MPLLGELKVGIYFIWRRILSQWCQGKKVQRRSPSPGPAGMRDFAVGKSWPPSLGYCCLPSWSRGQPAASESSQPAQGCLCADTLVQGTRVAHSTWKAGLEVGSCGGSGAAATPCPGLIRSGAARSVLGPDPRAQTLGGGEGSTRVTQPDWPMSAAPWGASGQ